MVLPRRAVAELSGLTDEEYLELWATVRDAVAAVETALRTRQRLFPPSARPLLVCPLFAALPASKPSRR